MDVLIIDVDPVLDEAGLEILCQCGYFVRSVRSTPEAQTLIDQTNFDCIVVGISQLGDSVPALAEIRQFARDAAVALITAGSAESIVGSALSSGSIELRSPGDLIPGVREFSQPTLVVTSHLDPGLTRAIRQEGVAAVAASSLMLAMNLLVDGWCHVVLLEAAIPGLTGRGEVAILHRIDAQLLAVLASALSTAPLGIVHGTAPRSVDEFIKLFEAAADNQISYCGLARTGT